MPKHFLVSNERGTLVAYDFDSAEQLLDLLGISQRNALVMELTAEQLALCESAENVSSCRLRDLQAAKSKNGSH